MTDIIFPPGVDEATQKCTRTFFSETEDSWSNYSSTELLVKQGICLEARWGDVTPLMHVVNWGDVEAVRAMIAYGQIRAANYSRNLQAPEDRTAV